MTTSVREQLKRLEEQREQLASTREQVIRSEKLASVGRLAAGVAHEVGNPLHSIIGFTEMLLQGGLDEQQVTDFLERIQNETQRIHRIIRELLDYARPVDDEIEAVQLADAVNQAIQLVGPHKKLQTIEVNREDIGDLPLVAANTQRMVQVLLNLLLNAADAIQGEEGKITLQGAVEPQNSWVELRVTNSGPEIEDHIRGRIFDPFFTTKEPGEGTGLGLSVAQSIVESYGGRLTLTDDSQTTFLLQLPSWKDRPL